MTYEFTIAHTHTHKTVHITASFTDVRSNIHLVNAQPMVVFYAERESSETGVHKE